MYPVSAAYKTAIEQNVRDVRITGTITLKDNSVINITDEDIVQGSLYITGAMRGRGGHRGRQCLRLRNGVVFEYASS